MEKKKIRTIKVRIFFLIYYIELFTYTMFNQPKAISMDIINF
jgi:hypothetical protein